MEEICSVDPSAVERELRRLAAKDPLNRAVLTNIVLFEPRDEELLTALAAAQPSRFFTISLDGVEALETGVRCREMRARSGQQIVTEEIFIRLPADSGTLLPNLLWSLYASDVPVVMIVPGDFFGERDTRYRELFSLLRRQCDVLIYDSQQFERFSRGALPYLGMKSPAVVADINWIRTERWRTLIAEQFESSRLVQCLPQLERIEIFGCFPDGLLASDVVLVSGWIADALGWRVRIPRPRW